jgi:hypothetical protein
MLYQAVAGDLGIETFEILLPEYYATLSLHRTIQEITAMQTSTQIIDKCWYLSIPNGRVGIHHSFR